MPNNIRDAAARALEIADELSRARERWRKLERARAQANPDPRTRIVLDTARNRIEQLETELERLETEIGGPGDL